MPSTHALNAPTPGTTSPSARIAAVRSAVSSTEAPARSSARTAERVLPEPKSRTTTAAVTRQPRAVDVRGCRPQPAECSSGAPSRDASQRPLGARHPGLSRVERDGVTERAGEGLVLSLHLMVRVAAGEHPDVQGDLRVEGQGLEDVPGQRPEVAHVAAADRDELLPVGLPGVYAVG